MQGLVTLDFGNSNPHAGLFQKNQGKWDLIKVVPWNELSLFLNQLEMTPNNTQFVLSEVKAREEELLPLLQQGYLLTRVKDYWRGERFAGMPVNYVKTLGEDRLITAHYSYKTDKTSTLIIDAGTFVTMDIVDGSGYHGGYIIPGAQVYSSLYGQGEQLKDVKVEISYKPGLPHTTYDAMAGSYKAFAALAREMINGNGVRKIILTGGQTSLWETFLKDMKSSLKIDTQPHFIHWALQHWMITQIEPL